jgi:hypothetical protein
MKTGHVTDYFAPLGRNTRFEELSATAVSLPIASLQSSLTTQSPGRKLPFDSADRFTYIIMGLAVLIAIVVPLLNLN